MANLDTYVRTDLEAYLIGDLQRMLTVDIGYPVLMTTFAGIELLGALLSKNKFDRNSGRQHFSSYWSDELYPSDPCRKALGHTVYNLARHGIAHSFLVKGPIAVMKNRAAMHLKWQGDIFNIDAQELATDFMNSFVRFRSKALTPGPIALQISDRLNEIEEAALQASLDHPLPVDGLRGTVTDTPAVTQSFVTSPTPTPTPSSHGASGPCFSVSSIRPK